MFSLKRFFLLFNIDFVYHKKFYFYFVMSIFLIFPLIHVLFKSYLDFNLVELLVVDDSLSNTVFFLILFCMMYFVSIYNMFSYFKSIHDPLKNVFYLSLPVSTLEKYLFVLSKFLFLFPLFVVICCYMGVNITVLLDKKLFLGNQTKTLSFNVFFMFVGNTYLIYFVGFSMLLLFRIVFKRFSFFKSVVIISLCYAALIVLFDFMMFFVNNYLFELKNNFDKWGEYYFIKYISMSFALCSCFYSYFLLRNVGNLSTKKINSNILVGLMSFFVIFVFCFVTFLLLYVIYAYILHA
ncbi:ABC transporter permease protein [Borrelia crocidurae DOU]|uniref:ABC transporter permease protein n=1 Tax=Borrelia crocidurae DOU TaxID=1293575 RepID=W5SJ18_9SPIR|nr:ABC transporter permease protein [Borrelia crocidurae DOU]